MAEDRKSRGVDYSGLTEYVSNVTIKNVDINPLNIKSIVVREWIFDVFPTIEIVFIDNGVFFDLSPLEDNAEIVVEISKSKKKESPISMTFLLHDFDVYNTDIERGSSMMIRVTGIFDCRNMVYPIHNRSFKQRTSIAALEEIASECGVEVDKRISTTNDAMVWLQLNQNNYDMIYHILERSFKEKNDTMFAYIDRSGKMVITSLKNELEKEDLITARHDIKKSTLDKQEDEEPDTEEAANEDNPIIYYNNYGYKYIGGTINKMIGYGMTHTYNDTKDVQTVTLDSDEHLLSDFSYKEKDSVGKIVKHISYGTKFDVDNTHDNYLTALSQNEYLRKNFFTSNLTIFINATNKVNLFDKVSLVLPTMLPTELTNDVPEINEVFSGEYIVGGILHQVFDKGQYKMVLSLFRNGIDKSASDEAEINLNGDQEAGAELPSLPSLPSL